MATITCTRHDILAHSHIFCELVLYIGTHPSLGGWYTLTRDDGHYSHHIRLKVSTHISPIHIGDVLGITWKHQTWDFSTPQPTIVFHTVHGKHEMYHLSPAQLQSGPHRPNICQ